MISAADYQTLDGIGLAQALRSGALGHEELLQAMLGEIERLNPRLNVVYRSMPELARQMLPAARNADGALAGLPILLKDLLADVAGYPTASGSRLLAQWTPQQDAEIVRRYRQAGLIFLGKTTTPEFGVLPVTESALSGVSCNPWDVKRTCGGSSGGAAAAVAARIVPIAHGGDGGGSIRIPASNCGVFGLKPGRGSSPCGPLFAEFWQGLVEQHVLTRSVRDSAAMLDIMLDGADWGDAHVRMAPPQPFLQQIEHKLPRLRIACSLTPPMGGAPCPEVVAAHQHSINLLRSLGHEVELASPPLDSADELCRVMLVVVCAELANLWRSAPQLLGRTIDWREVEAGNLVLARMGEKMSAGELAWARSTALRQTRILQTFFQRYDLLLTPVTNQLPALHGALSTSKHEDALAQFLLGRLGWSVMLRLPAMRNMVAQNLGRVMHYLGWTIPFNMSGHPAMSVPLYWTEQGLPLGTHVVAPMGQEGRLLQLAHELELAQPWAQRRPQT
ncbi:amidase [Massilia sp. W12]|uniref:amidase n=1 Tax=Massilia sp. W12 TaxID=3126507 RepID=UPI0030CB3C3C